MSQLPIMNLKKFKINKLAIFLDKQTWIIFSFFVVLIFFLFADLFNSYFEADEWFHFTYYFPLTRKPDGFLTAIISTIISSGPLSAGQHVIPVASAIYFLNTKFFGMNYPPYAFMSLLLHSINSFLVFLVIRTFLNKKEIITKNIFAILGGLFFALSSQPSHAITGAAPFYGQNILSVTFFLLCILSFKLAYLRENKKFIYISVLFLFLSLFTKETAVFLFLLLPFMAIIEKKNLPAGRQVFPLKFLGTIFLLSIVVYAIFRFLIPNIHSLPERIVSNWVDNYIFQSSSTQTPKALDTGTIVSQDLSIHKNLPGEILFRTITFPVKMTGTLFLPRQTVFSIVEFITPILQPVPPGGDSAEQSQVRLRFLYGAGNAFIIYLTSIIILIFCLRQVFRFIEKKQIQDAQALSTGLAIIILGALPLVAIIFSFPRWGYDFYFDSRFYYNPNVGAAIIFPFLLLGLSEFIYKSFRKKIVFPLIAFILFTLWLINNTVVLRGDIRYNTQNFQPDRREVVGQLKEYLPILPKKAVFYFETDSLSAYGPVLPFQTSVPQALTVVYYDKNSLPDSFFDKPLFNGKPEGYFYSEGRGFGYYTSKKKLSEDLLAGRFETSDIYAFYYKAKDVKLFNITDKVRDEMEDYLDEAKLNLEWKKFSSSSNNFSFYYPPQAIINEMENGTLSVSSPNFIAKISIFNITPAFDINEYSKIKSQEILGVASSKKVSYDKFHYNDGLVIIENESVEYLIKFDDKLVSLKTQNTDLESIIIIEKIAGSAAVSKQ